MATNMPGQGGKGQSQPQGKAQASGNTPTAPQGKQGSQGAPGASTGAPQGQPPNLLSLFSGILQGGGNQPVQNTPTGASQPPSQPMTAQGQRPIYNPSSQGYHGASSAQQNPNQGGASSSPSSISSPSTTQGGMT